LRVLALFKNHGKNPRDIPILKNTLDSLLKPEECKALVTNIRVSSRNIQIDVFGDAKAIECALVAIRKALGEPLEVRVIKKRKDEQIDEQELAKRVSSLIKEERFWEAHEELEDFWRKEGGSKKLALQALILLCAAYVHLQKNDTEGFTRLATRALQTLESCSVSYVLGFDLDALKQKIANAIKRSEFSVSFG